MTAGVLVEIRALLYSATEDLISCLGEDDLQIAAFLAVIPSGMQKSLPRETSGKDFFIERR